MGLGRVSGCGRRCVAKRKRTTSGKAGMAPIAPIPTKPSRWPIHAIRRPSGRITRRRALRPRARFGSFPRFSTRTTLTCPPCCGWISTAGPIWWKPACCAGHGYIEIHRKARASCVATQVARGCLAVYNFRADPAVALSFRRRQHMNFSQILLLLSLSSATDVTEGPQASIVQTATPATQPVANDQLLLEMLKEREDCSTFLRLLDRSGLRAALASGRPMTVFVPTDQAFANLMPPYSVSVLPGGPAAVQRQLVAGHIAWHRFLFADLAGGLGLETLGGNRLFVRKQGDTCKVAGATAEPCDLMVGNVAVHIIDAVLLPPRWAGMKDEELLRRDAEFLARSKSGGLVHASDCPSAAALPPGSGTSRRPGSASDGLYVVGNESSDVAGDVASPGIVRPSTPGVTPKSPQPAANSGGSGGSKGKPPSCGCGISPA